MTRMVADDGPPIQTGTLTPDNVDAAALLERAGFDADESVLTRRQE